MTRSRSAFELLLRRTEHGHRGPIPYHFFQQLLGSTDAVCPGYKAAGLAAGTFRDNARWSEDHSFP